MAADKDTGNEPERISTRTESVAMRQFRKERRKEETRVFRRQASEYFPAGGPEVDRANAQLIESAKQDSERRVAAFAKSFTYAIGCDWCGAEPDTGPEKTARILITPARYNAQNVCLKRAVYAFACFDCVRRLKLTAVDTKVLVTEREKAQAAARAEERARDKLAQQGLFPDERVNTDPLRNG